MINSDALAYQISQIRSTIRSIEAEEKNTLVANKEKIELQELVLAQGERELEAALESFEKAKVLYDEGAISKEDYEEIERFVETQRVSLASIKQELVILKNGNTEYYKALIQAQEASVAKLRSDIENCNVRTTTSGTITELAAKNANMASGVSPVAVVATGGEKTIQLYISTKDVASIKEGDGVDIVLKRRGGDLLFPGRIKHIDSVASVRPSALGVLESRVRVEVEPLMGEDNTSFGIGYYADVKFYLYKEGGKLTVPKSALFEDNGKDKVFAVKGGRAIEVEVTKGMELRTETVIEEGLMAGDVVISDANDKNIKNGKKVQ